MSSEPKTEVVSLPNLVSQTSLTSGERAESLSRRGAYRGDAELKSHLRSHFRSHLRSHTRAIIMLGVVSLTSVYAECGWAQLGVSNRSGGAPVTQATARTSAQTSAQSDQEDQDSQASSASNQADRDESKSSSSSETSAQTSSTTSSATSPATPPSQATAQQSEPKRTYGELKLISNERVPVRMRAASRDGATGLYHVYSADTGPQGTLRLSISGSGFSSDQFLTPGVEESFSRGDFSIAYTPISLVEVYANLRSTSYQNPLSSPSYLQGQGDLKLGAKASSFWGSLGAGVALNAQLYSDPQGSGWLGEATSFEMRALFTVDMTRGEAPVPFRFLIDTQFVFENSEALTAGLADEPSLIQEWGYQSARYDRLILNFGVEAPTEYISPFFSYHIGTPFLVEMPRMGQYSRIFAFESVPHQVAFGARGFARPEVALELGATIGLSDAPFTGVTATPPWTVWGGVTYTLDPRPEVMEREVKVEPPPPPKPEPPKPLGALLTLKVVDAKTGAPIKGARLSFVNEQMSALVSDDTGTITGHRIPPKRYVVAASAEGYKTRKVRLSIKEGREELKARLKLKPNKREAPAQLSISLELPPETNPNMTLELSLYGPSAQQTRLSAREPLKFSLKPGEYMLVVRDERERQHQELITLGGGGVAERVIKLSQLKRLGDASGSGDGDAGGASDDEGAESRPLKGSTKSFTFNLKRKSLRLKRAIGFAGNGAKLLRGSVSVLEKLGEFLKRERRVTKITIIVHTHSRGDAKADKRLGAKRGRAIKRVLTEAGVDAKRISIANYGSSKPLSSNITSRGRKRNQRVFIKIKSVQL